jgi:hypothetical protein
MLTGKLLQDPHSPMFGMPFLIGGGLKLLWASRTRFWFSQGLFCIVLWVIFLSLLPSVYCCDCRVPSCTLLFLVAPAFCVSVFEIRSLSDKIACCVRYDLLLWMCFGGIELGRESESSHLTLDSATSAVSASEDTLLRKQALVDAEFMQ